VPAPRRISLCWLVAGARSRLLYEAVIATVAGASCTDVRGAIHIHHTLSEGINAAAGGVHRETGA